MELSQIFASTKFHRAVRGQAIGEKPVTRSAGIRGIRQFSFFFSLTPTSTPRTGRQMMATPDSDEAQPLSFFDSSVVPAGVGSVSVGVSDVFSDGVVGGSVGASVVLTGGLGSSGFSFGFFRSGSEVLCSAIYARDVRRGVLPFSCNHTVSKSKPASLVFAAADVRSARGRRPNALSAVRFAFPLLEYADFASVLSAFRLRRLPHRCQDRSSF